MIHRNAKAVALLLLAVLVSIGRYPAAVRKWRFVPFRLPRNAQLWLPGYVRSLCERRRPPRHIWVMIGDHYEPQWDRPAMEVSLRRVAFWRRKWSEIAGRYADSDGRPPQYTFFYPEEEYAPELLEPLAELQRAGLGDVEIHLHHDGEPAGRFVDRMGRFIETLSGRHGLLHRIAGRPVFAFIHGNWALDNSLPDGRMCGLNNELTLLKQLGCYADFTLPSAPSLAQTSTVNRIYWATDDPERPKSHDRGIHATVSGGRRGDLLMVQGPLAVRLGQDGRWKPRLESGELGHNDPPTADRIRLWIRTAPQVGDHVFIKLFAHGGKDHHASTLLEGGLDRLFGGFVHEAKARDAKLHFGTAWDFYTAVEALCAGKNGGFQSP